MTPRQYSFVQFKAPDGEWRHYPFKEHGVYVYLGEIPNMKGHCVVIEHNAGTVISGYHIDSFTEIPDDET